MRRRPGARPARPQDAAPTGVAGVGVAVHRRVGGQRQQQRQPRPQPVAHPDCGVAVGHRDVHVAAADALLVRDHAELLGDLAVARGVGDRELVRHASGAARRRAAAPRRPRRPPRRSGAAGSARPRSSLAACSTTSVVVSTWQLVSSSCSLTPCAGGVAGDRLVDGRPVRRSSGRREGTPPRRQRWDGWPWCSRYMIRPVGCSHDGPDRAVAPCAVVTPRGLEVGGSGLPDYVAAAKHGSGGYFRAAYHRGVAKDFRFGVGPARRASRCRRCRTRPVGPRNWGSTCCTCPTTSARRRRSRR